MTARSRRLIRYTGLTIDGGAETESEGPPKKDSKFDPFRTTELRAGFPLDSSGCLWRQTQWAVTVSIRVDDRTGDIQQLPRGADGAYLNHEAETDVKCGTMETTIRKLSVSAMVLALLMLLFGSLMFLFGYFVLSEWRSERAALIACGALWILTGPAVFGSALWLLGSLGRSPLALGLGGTAVITSGTLLATAAAVGVLPCSGPA